MVFSQLLFIIIIKFANALLVSKTIIAFFFVFYCNLHWCSMIDDELQGFKISLLFMIDFNNLKQILATFKYYEWICGLSLKNPNFLSFNFIDPKEQSSYLCALSSDSNPVLVSCHYFNQVSSSICED